MNSSDAYIDMVRMLAKPGSDICRDLTPEMAHLWHMASALMGESGELYRAVDRFDRDNMVEEMGDIEFYLEGLRNRLGIDRSETVGFEPYPYPNLYSDLTFTARMFCTSCDVFDIIKKAAIYNKPLIVGKIIEVLLALECHFHALRREHDITWEETIAHNEAKLAKRYAAGKYSDQAAQIRADKPEGE